MPKLLLEKLQQQLLQKEQILAQCNWDYFQSNLKAYMKFIEENPLLQEIVTNLKKEQVLSASVWLGKYNTDRMPYLPDSAKGQAAQCFMLLEAVKNDQSQYGFSEYVMSSLGDLHDKKRIFFNNIFKPFHSYMLENIEEGNFNEFILKRYKRWCEWYRQEELKEKLSTEQKKVDNKEKGKREFEKILTTDAVSFLFLNGITPISVTLGNCKPDITTDIFAVNPLATEVKIFMDKGDIKELKAGVRQLSQALSTTGLSTGFLIIFNLGNANLEITDDQQDKALIPIIINVTEVPPNELKDNITVAVSELRKEN